MNSDSYVSCESCDAVRPAPPSPTSPGPSAELCGLCDQQWVILPPPPPGFSPIPPDMMRRWAECGSPRRVTWRAGRPRPSAHEQISKHVTESCCMTSSFVFLTHVHVHASHCAGSDVLNAHRFWGLDQYQHCWISKMTHNNPPKRSEGHQVNF